MSRKSHGSALLIVLVCITLMAILVVGYLTGAQSALSSSSAFASGANARRIADSAQALALAQIKAGTSGGTDVAWASQPGAIRTYDKEGNPASVYKLYSAEKMIAEASSFTPAEDLPPADWKDQPSVYVDLNAPVGGRYPIVNPAAAENIGGYSQVEGFSIDRDAPVLAQSANPAAMPVRWIYELKDGTLVIPEIATGSRTVIPGASNQNPPVARMAFWTDDETCKLNVNTASEGTYWDSPMYAAHAELYFARYQPAQREYQRYPGHPATTSLSPVFWNFLDLPSPNYSLVPVLTPARNADGFFSTRLSANPQLSSAAVSYFQSLFQITPRIVNGGSKMGSVPTVLDNSAAIGAVDNDRLYASVDELLFARPASPVTAARPANPPLNQEDLEKVRFFLTTSSRAPEVNLFNQPKIVMWPIDDPASGNPGNSYNTAADSQSPLDKLIAFCGTLNKQPYYFVRNDPLRTSADFTGRNAVLYEYLERLLGRKIPAFGDTFRSRYGVNGCSHLLTLIYDYIRSNINLADTSAALSGSAVAESAKLKYAFSPGRNNGIYTGRGQVVPFKHPTNGTKGLGRMPTIRQTILWFTARAANQPPVMVNSSGQPIDSNGTVITTVTQAPVVNPMHPWTANPGSPSMTIAAGLPASLDVLNRYPAISAQTHAGLPFLTTLGTDGKYSLPNPRYPSSLPALAPHQTLVQPVFSFEAVNNSVGNLGINPDYKVRVRGLQAFSANGTNLGLPSDATETFVKPSSIVFSSQYNQGFMLEYRRVTGAADGVRGNPLLTFAGKPVIVNGDTFAFQGGLLDIDILDAAGEVVQTFHIDYPSTSFPTPLLPVRMPDRFVKTGTATYPPILVSDLIPSTLLTVDCGDSLGSNPNAGTGGTYYNGGISRLVFPNGGTGAPDPNSGPGKNLFLPERGADPASDTSGRSKLTCDTIRSVECKYGDTRLTASLAEVPTDFFTPHRDYYNTSIRSALTGSRGGTVHPLTDAPTNFSAPTGNYFATNWGLPNAGSDAMRNRLAVRMDGNFPETNLFPFNTSSADFTDANFQTVWSLGGDFDTGLATHPDGPFINKPEEGTVLYNPSDTNWANPYFDSFVAAFSYIGSTLFSPNRQVPSPAILGSLPVGNTPEAAWRTLLFSPNPNSKTHSALGANPPDYALLDFFHMPVVEPYAISEPLSTAGKVNLNYQIVPFTYLHRDTAVRGVLKSVDITAIPDKARYRYKSQFRGANRLDFFGDGGGVYDQSSVNSGYWDARYPIHAAETLKQFDEKFAGGEIFRSASEICSLWLYPATQPTATNPQASEAALITYNSSASNIKAWWYGDAGGNRKSLTGDNLRERPYALLYPRLTTKSNTYTIHVRSQVLRTRVAADGSINESANPVAGEWRGSFLVERYVDPNDSALPDFAAPASADIAVDSFYRFRTISTKQLSP